MAGEEEEAWESWTRACKGLVAFEEVANANHYHYHFSCFIIFPRLLLKWAAFEGIHPDLRLMARV